MARRGTLTARLVPALVAGLAAAAMSAAAGSPRGGAGVGAVAILPVDNLSGGAAPLEEIRSAVEEAVAARGVAVVPRERVEAVLRDMRIRHTGGVTDEAARALRDSAGAGAVLITSLAAYDPTDPPRVAIEGRLVSVEGDVAVPAWADGVALAGDDAPGAFDLGLVHDPAALVARAVATLAEGLAERVAGGGPASAFRAPRAKGRFSPRSLFVSADAPALGGESRRVAILPFANDTPRRSAGDVVALQFVRQLVAAGEVEVVEPGRVRKALLDARIVQEGGISHAQADLLHGILEADLVIAGRVSEFREDAGGSTPRVELTAYALDARRRKIAWLARTHAEGWKGARFFRLGELRSATRLASELVRGMLRDVNRRAEEGG